MRAQWTQLSKGACGSPSPVCSSSCHWFLARAQGLGFGGGAGGAGGRREYAGGDDDVIARNKRLRGSVHGEMQPQEVSGLRG